MNHTPIFVTRNDYYKLRMLVASALYSPAHGALKSLRRELDRAIVLDPKALPQGVVTIDSYVEFEDTGSGEVESYTITYPDCENLQERRLSILAPIGTALIGCQEGDLLHWTTAGCMRRLRIRRVSQPSAAAAPVGSQTHLALDSRR